MRRRAVAAALAVGAAAACAPDPDAPFDKRSLVPAANPFGPSDPLWSPQPRRDHPFGVALSKDGHKLYVTLQGVEDEPGTAVAVVDTRTETLLRRIEVGSGPTGLELHPDGRFLVVTNRFSNYASVIDTERDEVVADIPVPYYTVDVAFSPDGRRAYLANRWKDAVLRWDLDVASELRVVGGDVSYDVPEAPAGLPVGDNPRTLSMSPDGSRLYVASITGMTVSVIDTAAFVESARLDIGSPPGGVLALGDRLFVTHTGRGSQHPPDEGHDTDGDGVPGDGTANVMFQDLQNEIDVRDPAGAPLRAYTSDTICCFDFRDVDPDHPEKGALLPAPDTWPESRLSHLAPRESWIVAGALPEQMAVHEGTLLVVFSGSNEVQSFRMDPDGSLAPLQSRGGLFRTGMNPAEIALSPDGLRAYVAERLGEHITVLDLSAGPGSERRIAIGDPDAPPFPATDAEIGESVNFVTAPLTVDGDQTCVHCHREGGNIGKPIAMPLQTDPVWGTRMVMAYRGAADTRPWFFETAMTETNFFPVTNELDRKENYCCEGTDPLVWSKYPPPEACAADPSLPGCGHVLHCVDDPPPECAERSYGSPYATRNEHLLEASRGLLGRDRTFGDALREEDFGEAGAAPARGIALDFNGITRSLGLFLLARPRFFPNPNAAVDSAAARRGRAIYESPSSGCNTCHPLPLTTVTEAYNPAGVPLRFPPLVTPRKGSSGGDADRVTPGFLQTFPMAEQDEGGVRFGVPQLRGIWDRARRFYHDGRSRSLREALATPGHPVLRPGEVGHNETHGMPDTHGSTSTMSVRDLEDVIVFLETL